MYVGWDSTTIDAVPHDAHLVLPYNEGDFTNEAEARRLYPRAIIETISVHGRHPSHWLDIESGNATVNDAESWYWIARNAGIERPGYYGSLSTMEALKPILQRAGLPRPIFRLWVADPTGRPHIPDGYDGCQWLWKAMGRNLDESLFRQDAITGNANVADEKFYAEIEVNAHTGQWEVRGVPRDTKPLG